MRGSPRSLMLSWANTVAGWWTSTAVTAMQRQQRAVRNALTKPKPAAKAKLTAKAKPTAKTTPARKRRGKRKPR
jgi:hypothetical protein